MTAEKINGDGGQVRTPYRSRTPRRTPEEREALREAQLQEAVAETLAQAPPPSEWQLAVLARLCAAHPLEQPAERIRKTA